VFKRLFGKPDDELSGLNMNRFASPGPADRAEPPTDPSDLKLPSRKPPPNVKDLVLPETLAEEAKHPRDVDLSFAISSRASGSPAASSGPAEITDAQIEAIAQRVADKLAAGVLGDRLRETVVRIVSETSERLVREEIARIRAEADAE
jgi:hypothetical protein